LSALLPLFLNNILPILLAAAAGFSLGRYLNVEPRTLSRVVFYVFSPSLLFTLIAKSQLNDAAILRMMAMAVLQLIAVGSITLVLGRILRLERRLLIAVLLTTMFMNAGNYGLSLNEFAFGEAALAQASLFFATQGMLIYTLGVIIASLGKFRLTDALKSLLKLPFLYALILAILFLNFGWTIPLPLDRTVELLARAAVPAMLILLGLQLQRAQWTGQTLALVLTNTVRLVISPLIAILISSAIGLQGAARQAGILESAMPIAVMTTVLATEYDIEPAFVTTAVFTSTVLSPLTLTPLLAYLGA
jgi:predicted permease